MAPGPATAPNHDHGESAAQVDGRRRSHVLVAVAFALLTFICFAPALVDPAHRFIGGGTDPLEKMWFLEWTPYALTHHQALLDTTVINYPTGVNMMWNTSTLLLGVVLSPVTALFGPVVAFNLGMYFAVLASAWCGYWAIWRLVRHTAGSVVGGLLYGFSPYMMGQSHGHLTLLVMVYPPVALVLFHEIVVLQRRRWWVLGSLLGVASAAQIFISEEVLASTAIAVAIALIAVALVNRDRVRARLGYVLRATLVGVGLAVILSGWALWYQFTGPDQLHQTLQEFGAFVTDPLGFVIPTANQLIAPPSLVALTEHFRGNLAEWDGYLGLPLLGILASAVWRYRRSRLIQVVAATAVVVAILSIGPYVVIRGHQFPIPLPWLVTEHIPVVKNLLPNRFMAHVFLLAGVAIAYVIAQLKPAPLAAHWRAGVVALAAVLLLLPALPRPSTSLPPGVTVSEKVREVLDSGGVVLPSPFATPDDPKAMLVQAETGFAFSMPGGYAYAPNLPPVAAPSALAQLDASDSAQLRATALASAGGRAQALSLLRASRVQTIVVLAGPGAREFEHFWTALLARAPAMYGGVAIWTGVTGLTAGG
jgi:hypothetical protein